jgi:hypothetical protein
MSTPYR